ncbi:PREDICTED: thiopurine S-methyltransferase-like, partial [Priapulus caudatus]|uniref:Thiopurine S-methyltransferase-like n=1 Tax=Priapulus caudatus TaxID=37621 RepID=A0ABM1F879_PRICU
PAKDKRSDLKVFVPLCGKSADVHWLSTLGYQVLGVECSEIAVKAFFEEQNIQH